MEKGIDHKDLGLPTSSGSEFPPFTREDLERGRTDELERFLLRLHVMYGGTRASRARRSYKQRQLAKTVYVYRSGAALIKNTSTIRIVDGDAFLKQGNGVRHRIELPNGVTTFPGFELMARTPLSERRSKPVFSCCFIGRNHKRIEQPMKKLVVRRQTDVFVEFFMEFPVPARKNDFFSYQYVWSIPGMFRCFEEDFGAEGDYNEVYILPNHGMIGEARLRLKFERETLHGTSATLFSKEPFALLSLTGGLDGIVEESQAEPLQQVDVDSTWETYEIESSELEQAMIVRWRPSSRVAVERELDAARFRKVEGPPAAGRAQQRMTAVERAAD